MVLLAPMLPPPVLLPLPPARRRTTGTVTATMRTTTTNTTRPSPRPKIRCFRPHLCRAVLASSTVKSSSEASSSSSVVSRGIPSLKDMLIYKVPAKWLPTLCFSLLRAPHLCASLCCRTNLSQLRHVTFHMRAPPPTGAGRGARYFCACAKKCVLLCEHKTKRHTRPRW